LTHEQSKIEAADVEEQPFPNVGVSAEEDTAHAAGFKDSEI
jgi:hypothetical protein